MAFILQENAPTTLRIELEGSDGNAFVLMGITSSLMKQLGFSRDEVKETTDTMMSGDYGDLLITMDDAVGDYIDLIFTPKVLASIDNMEFTLKFLTD